LLQGNEHQEFIHKQMMGDAYAYIASAWLRLVIDTHLEHFQMGQGNAWLSNTDCLKQNSTYCSA
jgi:hypothetical protein